MDWIGNVIRSDWERMVRKHKKKHAGNFNDDDIRVSDVQQEQQMDYEPTTITPTRRGVDDKHKTTLGREVKATMRKLKREARVVLNISSADSSKKAHKRTDS